MLGMVSVQSGAAEAAPLPSWEHLVRAPHSLRRQSEAGKTLPEDPPGHADSWGIGWFDSLGRVSLIRQTGSAAASAFFALTAEAAAREQGKARGSGARTLIGHLRKAVCGAVTSENAHPVRVDYPVPDHPVMPYESLLVAHNGTVKPPLLQTLREELAGREEARSDCDTVVLAGWLGARMEAAPNTPMETMQAALSELQGRAEQVSAGDLSQAYSGLVLLIAFSGGLFALRQYSRNPQYYTLYRRRLTPADTVENSENAVPVAADGWIIASEPTDNGDWELMEPGVLSYFSVKSTDPILVPIAVQ